MDKFKKILFFIFVLALFMIPGYIFGRNTDFYQELTKPSFAPKGIVFAIVWPILYIIQSYYITHIYYNYHLEREGQKLLLLLIINGVLNIIYTPVFFVFKSIFGGFVVTLFTLVSLILIILKSKEMNIKKWYFEIPYMLWLIFALVLSISLYLMN